MAWDVNHFLAMNDCWHCSWTVETACFGDCVLRFQLQAELLGSGFIIECITMARVALYTTDCCVHFPPILPVTLSSALLYAHLIEHAKADYIGAVVSGSDQNAKRSMLPVS